MQKNSASKRSGVSWECGGVRENVGCEGECGGVRGNVGM